jgi:hypothetical protein
VSHPGNLFPIDFCKSFEISDWTSYIFSVWIFPNKNFTFKVSFSTLAIVLTKHDKIIFSDAYALAYFMLNWSQSFEYRVIKSPVNINTLINNDWGK